MNSNSHNKRIVVTPTEDVDRREPQQKGTKRTLDGALKSEESKKDQKGSTYEEERRKKDISSGTGKHKVRGTMAGTPGSDSKKTMRKQHPVEKDDTKVFYPEVKGGSKGKVEPPEVASERGGSNSLNRMEGKPTSILVNKKLSKEMAGERSVLQLVTT